MNDQLPEEIERVLKFIRPSRKIVASADFKDRVMTKLMEENTTMKKHGFKTILRLAAVGAGGGIHHRDSRFWAGSGKVLRRSPRRACWRSRSRRCPTCARFTSRRECELTPETTLNRSGLDEDFQPIEMWKQFGNPPQWRIEKPGRVVVMDGKSAFLWIKPDIALKQAERGFRRMAEAAAERGAGT